MPGRDAAYELKRADMIGRFNVRFQEVVVLGDGNGCKARCHHSSDDGRGDDDFVPKGLFESMRGNLFGQYLNPEEALILAEEERELLEAEPRNELVEDDDESFYSLSHYTDDPSIDPPHEVDEFHCFGREVPKTPSVSYPKRRVLERARQAALLSA